jgi:FkbM family methyltransferase
MRKLLGPIYDALPFKQPVLAWLRPLGLPGWLYKHLHFKGVFEVQTPTRPFRIVHHGYEIENELFWEGLPGRRERVSMSLWMALCRDAKVILDVGANTGVYSLAAKAINPGAKVYGFEPVPRVFEKYRQNCRLNDYDIVAEQLALSDRDGTATLFDLPGEHVMAATLDPLTYPETASRRVGVEVRAQTLATYVAARHLDRIDLIKLDVEGHEPAVLRGMGPYLSRFKPTLIVEVLTDSIAGDLEKILGGLDYIFFDIDETGPPRPSSTLRASSHWNILVCQPVVATALGLDQPTTECHGEPGRSS